VAYPLSPSPRTRPPPHMYPPCRSVSVLRPCTHATRTHKRQTCPKRPGSSLPTAAPPRGVHPSALTRDGRLSVPVGGVTSMRPRRATLPRARSFLRYHLGGLGAEFTGSPRRHSPDTPRQRSRTVCCRPSARVSRHARAPGASATATGLDRQATVPVAASSPNQKSQISSQVPGGWVSAIYKRLEAHGHEFARNPDALLKSQFTGRRCRRGQVD